MTHKNAVFLTSQPYFLNSAQRTFNLAVPTTS
jgi:hypothetical protein